MLGVGAMAGGRHGGPVSVGRPDDRRRDMVRVAEGLWGIPRPMMVERRDCPADVRALRGTFLL